MAWSYTGDMTVTRNQVRFLIGDTNDQDPQLQDGEIDFILTERADLHDAASMAARTLAALYARKVDRAIGRAREALNQRFEHYRQLAEDLAKDGAGATVGDFPLVFAGGIDPSNVDYWNEAGDRIAPAFSRSTLNGFVAGGGSSTEEE